MMLQAHQRPLSDAWQEQEFGPRSKTGRFCSREARQAPAARAPLADSTKNPPEAAKLPAG
jgi:hypothetical protein